MTTLLQRTRPTFGEQVAGGLQKGAQTGSQLATHKYQANLREKELAQKLAGQKELQAEKFAQENEVNLKDYEVVKDAFGEKFADLYKTASTGGKTKLLESGIDAMLRGGSVEDFLGNVSKQDLQDEGISDEKPTPQLKKGRIPEDFELPDYSKPPRGFTPKDWASERKDWRKTNNEVFENTNKQLKSNAIDRRGVKKLMQLNKSGKVGEGFGRTLINPKTGEFYGIAQLTGSVAPEAQEWVKEIARFGNRAKDAFGSRVTNFDLQQYMKQFPGLLNTHEGRERILRMMQINYDLDNLYDTALQQIYHKKGLAGIPPEEANRLAREMIKDEAEYLDNEYLGIDSLNQTQEQMQHSKNNRPSLSEIFG